MGLDMNLPKKNGLFITATDTEVGKTIVSGAISRILSESGSKVGVFKPFASDCRKEWEGLVNSDAEFLAHCSKSPLPLSTINPISYVTPAATILCEQLEHRAVDFQAVADAYKNICANSDIVVVEGIGGVRVPLTSGVDVLDFAKQLDLPMVVVARANLGTINHTLLTIDAIRSRGLKLAGVVISGYDADSADIVVENNAEIISAEGDVDILSIVPFSASVDTENLVLPDEITETLAMTDWKKIAGL